jgi:hypothetical protein
VTARLTIHDVNMADLTGGALVGPLDLPPADAIREVLLDTARRHPEHRLFCRPQKGRFGWRWVPLSAAEREQRCIEMVSVIPETMSTDELTDDVLKPFEPDRLLHFGLSGSRLVIYFAHVLGDTSMAALTPALLQAAAGDGPPPQLDDTSVGFPLARAMAHHFGRQPRRLVQVLREPRPAVVHGEGEFVGTVAFASYGRTASAEVMAELDEWRAAHCPEVSASTVLTAAIRRAFDEAGIKFASPGLRLLVNGRRYLPATAPVAGNFAAAIYIEPDDPSSPRSVDAVVRRNLECGRPLATMAVSGLKELTTARRAGSPAATLSTLTVSNLGRIRPIEPLPLAPDVEYRCANMPSGPDGVTVLLAQVGRRCTMTATFTPEVVAREDVAVAIERLTRDPISLLDRD